MYVSVYVRVCVCMSVSVFVYFSIESNRIESFFKLVLLFAVSCCLSVTVTDTDNNLQ